MKDKETKLKVITSFDVITLEHCRRSKSRQKTSMLQHKRYLVYWRIQAKEMWSTSVVGMDLGHQLFSK
jgi:hypothetical protein